MNSTTHPVAPEEVMALLDGELAPERMTEVRSHVSECDECAETLRNLREASQALLDWEIQPSPKVVGERIAEAAQSVRAGHHVGHESVFVRLAFWPRKKWLIVAGASAAVLVLLAFISISNLMRVSTAMWGAHIVAREQLAPTPYPGIQKNLPRVSQSRPVNGRALNSVVTLSQPGVAADSNGMFHGLGDRATSFSVDEASLNDQKSEVISNGASEPMIARTVALSIVVKDFAASRANLDAILRRHGGYAANLTANTAENAPRSVEASLRVPATDLDAAIGDLKALGKVQQESQNGEEVTQQHADLVARLKNSREEEQRLQAILQQRTGKLSDVLEVERETARVRGEIEQMDAEQKGLEHRVEFATVNLSLSEEYKEQLAPSAISAGTRLHNALVEGYRSASETLLGIVLFFAEYTLTLLIWGAMLVLPAFLLWKRFRRALAAV
jgi:hypothetical protein